MKGFLCLRCGKVRYSAAEPAFQTVPSCPYCGFNGQKADPEFEEEKRFCRKESGSPDERMTS
jgi:hypothetical protein